MYSQYSAVSTAAPSQPTSIATERAPSSEIPRTTSASDIISVTNQTESQHRLPMPEDERAAVEASRISSEPIEATDKVTARSIQNAHQKTSMIAHASVTSTVTEDDDRIAVGQQAASVGACVLFMKPMLSFVAPSVRNSATQKEIRKSFTTVSAERIFDGDISAIQPEENLQRNTAIQEEQYNEHQDQLRVPLYTKAPRQFSAHLPRAMSNFIKMLCKTDLTVCSGLGNRRQ